MPNSPRFTHSSLRHLSADYAWDLPSFDPADPTASQLFTTEPKIDKINDKQEKKERKDKKGAIPKTRPSGSTPDTPNFNFPPGLPEHIKAGTPPSRDDEITRLQLLKENQDREIRKLELRLQLAQLESRIGGATQTSETATNNKSLGDVKAPQKITNPQQWPHIYAPGEPKLYVDLSLAEFCAGYTVIIQQLADKPNRETIIKHFHELMVLASSYQWSAVRSYHYKVLRSIELGLVNWGDSFEPLKQSFFLPTCLLTNSPPKAAKPGSKPPPTPLQSQSAIARHQICDAWSWYDDCATPDCPKSHICVVCKRSDHQAFTCPKRKFPVPLRRSDTASKV